MGIFEGMERKFVVLKILDIEKHLDSSDKQVLIDIQNKINVGRYQENKRINVYLVVNIDEPYAPELVERMKECNQWGSADPNQLEAFIDNGVLKLPAYEMGD